MSVITPAVPAPPPAAPPPPDGPAQGRLFQRLRWRLLVNSGRQLLSGTPIRLVSIVLCSVVVWLAVFGATLYGFQLTQDYIHSLAGLLFDVLFLTLGVMLLFSSSVMLYSSLFTTAEVRFLLSTPARSDQVFAYKYQAAVAFSSWAFVLLGSPVPIAFGWRVGAPWYFYALLPVFFLGFALIPTSVGAAACFAVVNFAPRRRRQVLALAGLLLVALLALWGYQTMRSAQASPTPNAALRGLIGQFAFARSDWNPSHWMAEGLLAASRGELTRTAFGLTLVVSNGLFLYLLAALAARYLYRPGYDRLQAGGGDRRRFGTTWADVLAGWSVFYLHPQTRLLVVKDFRTFRRDPAQWAQILVFGGLILAYFSGMRRFYLADIGKPFQNGVSLVNLCATAMLMCAYMGRFIYPMLSLEGRKFWVLGLLPLPRERLLWGKFAFAATGAVLIGEALILTSDLLLGLPVVGVLVHAWAVLVLGLGLAGLSVGLGAIMPNFRETDPSKIAVGFGGTLSLVVCLLYVVVVVVVVAGPFHVVNVIRPDDLEQPAGLRWVAAGAAGGLAAAALAVALPLRAGAASLRRIEF